MSSKSDDAAGSDWRADPSPADLHLVRDYGSLEALVASGVDSSRVLVLDADDPAAVAWAEQGLRQRRGPLRSRPFDPGRKSLVALPTYEEAENLEAMVADIRAYLRADVLVVDDASPDGTGRIAERLAAEHPGVHVLHRSGKRGLGTAYVEAWRWAERRGYELIFQMDCDFSHAPWDLPRLAVASSSADLVIGSRYVPGGSTIGWDLRRRLLSRGANLYARCVLGLPVRDATAGFRCFQAEKLFRLDLDEVRAEGYAFQIEMAYRFHRAGFSILEIPIHFRDRRVGNSKMDARVACEAALLVPALRWRVRRGRLLRSTGTGPRLR